MNRWTELLRRTLAVVMAAAALTAGLIVVSGTPALAAGHSITNRASGRCVAPVNNNTVDRNIRLVLSAAPCRIRGNIVDEPGDPRRKYIKLDANSARCWVPSGSSQLEGVAIVTGTCANTVPFLWWPERVGSTNYYRWRNDLTLMCLTVDPPGTASGSPLVQRPCQADAHLQQFTW